MYDVIWPAPRGRGQRGARISDHGAHARRAGRPGPSILDRGTISRESSRDPGTLCRQRFYMILRRREASIRGSSQNGIELVEDVLRWG